MVLRVDMEATLQSRATQFLYREAHCLDHGKWDEWAHLYAEDCEFWVPAWKNDAEVTDDPDEEISLIYIRSRKELVDRAERVSSGRSIASLPRRRTVHTVSNVLIDGRAEGNSWVVVSSAWTVHIYNPKIKKQDVFFTLCEHYLEESGNGFLIKRRKAILQNDYLPTMMDFYSV